jgi:hypothetical protein
MQLASGSTDFSDQKKIPKYYDLWPKIRHSLEKLKKEREEICSYMSFLYQQIIDLMEKSKNSKIFAL